MKKIIILLFCITIIYAITCEKTEQIMIPEESIRFRVIANSDSIEDQNKKKEIKKAVDTELNKLMIQATNIEEARNLIKNDLPTIEKIINEFNVDYKMNYGYNYFPEKEYKGITYDAGNYESLVITLGSGIGKNWWCVMFPPLCLLEAEENDLKEVEYKSYVKTILDKYIMK